MDDGGDWDRFIDRAHLEAIPRLDHIQPSARADPELEYAKQLVEAELESIRKQGWGGVIRRMLIVAAILAIFAYRMIAAMSPILISMPPETVPMTASIAMAITTWLALRARGVTGAWILVFLAGVSMAPMFPTALAMVGDAFPRMTATAIGFAITCGWAGLAVSSRLIGAMAGGDPKRLKTALLVIPAFSVVMIGLNLVIRSMLH